MSKSPGHVKWPDHKVIEQPLHQRITVEIGGERVADSDDVIRVDEDGNPPRYYFPVDAVSTDKLEASHTTTQCPFKGTAHYFNVKKDNRTLSDVVWTYDSPYDEHHALQGRLAFYEEHIPQFAMHTGP